MENESQSLEGSNGNAADWTVYATSLRYIDPDGYTTLECAVAWL